MSGPAFYYMYTYKEKARPTVVCTYKKRECMGLHSIAFTYKDKARPSLYI